MVQLDDGAANRPVSGAGGRDIIEEEEQVGSRVESTPGPSSDAGPRADEASPSPTISSASDSAPPPTARHLQRVQRRLVRATEHLRDSLADTKGQLWEKVYDDTQERQQEALALQKLLDDRVEMMSTAFRAALDNLRDDTQSQLTVIADSAHEAMEKLAENVQQAPSDSVSYTHLTLPTTPYV